MGRKKKPKHKEKPQKGAIPRTAENPLAYKAKNLRWSFELFDETMEWYQPNYKPKSFNKIAGHLKSYERRTWGNIEADTTRDHTVLLSKLIPKAQKQLEKLNIDDHDRLLRLRVNAIQRIWGVRVDDIFMVLWWDPQHKICPSKKRKT